MAGKKVTSYVCTVTPEQADALRELLDRRGWEFRELQYARYKAVFRRITGRCVR